VARYQGFVTVSKRHFWQFFIKAYKQAFTAKNIASGWETTGIEFLEPERILARIIKRKRKSEIDPNAQPKTPRSTRALRKTYGILHAQAC
jgi:hypothetical protein